MNTDYPIPVQVDGEPWLQPPCDITIIRSALKVLSNQRQNFSISYSILIHFRQQCFENVNQRSNVEIQNQVSIFPMEMRTQNLEIFSRFLFSQLV